MKDLVFGCHTKYFTKIELQVRGPMSQVKSSGVGYRDDSFAFPALDREPNGGETMGWFF